MDDQTDYRALYKESERRRHEIERYLYKEGHVRHEVERRLQREECARKYAEHQLAKTTFL